MTPAQKRNVERFKKAAAEAKKLRAKNPKLTQAEAVKKAFATLYGTAKKAAPKKAAPKKTVKKKAAPKKVAKNKTPVRKIGALPVGFTGKFLGWPFKVLNQMTLDGGVTAQIVELNPPGSIVAELNGRKQDVENAYKKILGKISLAYGQYFTDRYAEKDKKRVEKAIKDFLIQLNSEVSKYNSGADKRTKQAKPAVIKYTAKVKKLALVDQIKKILADNNKRLKRGYATVPGKPRIKGDIVGAIKTDAADSLKKMISHLSAVQAEKQANKKTSAKMTAAQKKQQAAHLRNLAKTETAVKKRISELKRAI